MKLCFASSVLLLVLLHLVKCWTIEDCDQCLEKVLSHQAVAIYSHFAGQFNFFRIHLEKLMFMLGKEQFLCNMPRAATDLKQGFIKFSKV